MKTFLVTVTRTSTQFKTVKVKACDAGHAEAIVDEMDLDDDGDWDVILQPDQITDVQEKKAKR